MNLNSRLLSLNQEYTELRQQQLTIQREITRKKQITRVQINELISNEETRYGEAHSIELQNCCSDYPRRRLGMNIMASVHLFV